MLAVAFGFDLTFQGDEYTVYLKIETVELPVSSCSFFKRRVAVFRKADQFLVPVRLYKGILVWDN